MHVCYLQYLVFNLFFFFILAKARGGLGMRGTSSNQAGP